MSPRRLPLAAVVLILTVALTACGDDDASGGDPRPEPGGSSAAAPAALSEEQAKGALLGGADLGAGWVEQPNVVEADDEPIFGCIGTIDNLLEMGERAVEVRRSHKFEDAFPQVSQRVTVWSDEDQVVEVFDRIEEAVEECGDEEFTDQGVTYRISLEPTTDLPVDGIDDQFGYVASGSFVEDGEEYPVHLHVNRFRVGANVTALTTTATEDETTIHEQYARLAAERLVGATDGR